MRISNCINRPVNISFQKSLVAKCKIKKGDAQEECYIHKLDKKTDSEYFDKYLYDTDCEKSFFIEELSYRGFYTMFDIRGKNTSVYVMEDSNNKFIGVCSVNDSFDDSIHLLEIETKPAFAYSNKNRETKYVGETLITFLNELVKRQGKEWLVIPSGYSKAADFYFQNCGFEELNERKSAKIGGEASEKLSEQNQRHTGSKIIFVG